MKLLSIVKAAVFFCAMLLASTVAIAAESVSSDMSTPDVSEQPPVADSVGAGAADATAATGAADTATASPESGLSGRAPPYDWAFTGYVAWLSGDQLGDMLIFNAELSDNKIWVAALTYRILTFYKDVDWEVEGQVGKQGGGSANMYNWEFNALTDVRWNRFVWDKYVETSFAVGLGLSYATEVPQFEVDEHGASDNLMAYILVELAFSPPKHQEWAGVIRIHHRSSAYGTFQEDIQGASNSLGVGIKYRF